MTLKQWLKTFHPNVIELWEQDKLIERRKYGRKWQKEHYKAANKKPSD